MHIMPVESNYAGEVYRKRGDPWNVHTECAFVLGRCHVVIFDGEALGCHGYDRFCKSVMTRDGVDGSH